MITNNINDLSLKYNNIVSNYTIFFLNNIVINKKVEYYYNIYVKGLILIQNIFNLALINLDNIYDIYNNCEKGYIYYIEFINQIEYPNIQLENNIDLTIRDAVIFSYKKTVLTFENKISSINEQSEILLLNNNKSFVYFINNFYITIFIIIYKKYILLKNNDNNINNYISNNSLLNIYNELTNKNFENIVKKYINNLNKKLINENNLEAIIQLSDYLIKIQELLINNNSYNNYMDFTNIFNNIFNNILKFLNKLLIKKDKNSYDNNYLTDIIFKL
tara:strand:- start:181 stop:1005 length:825 start_codon:yes stop_codon:yes gene_type:complete